MPTVTRVLPWRRHEAPPSVELAPVLEEYRRTHGKAQFGLIVRAHEVARAAHDGQVRRSGEPYITHPVAVATIVARYGMDAETVAAALLHDAVEDTSVTLAEIADQFGAEVAAIVDGVTKLDRVHFDSKAQQQAATMRKMFVAMAQDLRVIVIKLADRLHNMRTIAGLPADKQERTATETLDVYAPLAHRLGMGEVRQQLEDLCFAALHPKRYAEIDLMVQTRAPERELFLAQVLEEVRVRLDESLVEAEVSGRPKHLWSIYEKMASREKRFDDIWDLVGIRVVVDSVKDCYAALGTLHSLWTPVPGRFKDYIAMPKFNLYQSLHTTVIGPQGKPLEVQIRTREMHARAERGVAAHFAYKEGDHAVEDAQWLNRLVDWQQEMVDPSEFMANLKLDLGQDEVFVFTPKGDVVVLPIGATPVDLAYSIHTDVGHRCSGARVDGKLVPLQSRLTSGQTVEIITSKVDSAGPSEDWLRFVASRSAASKIRQYFNKSRRDDALETGRDELLKQLRREGLPAARLLGGEVIGEVVAGFGVSTTDELLRAIGERRISARAVAGRLGAVVRGVSATRDEVAATPRRRHRRRASADEPVGVHVEGFDDLLVRMARCCMPAPGDAILGFVTRGRGVSIHRTDCSNAAALSADGDRVLSAEWDDAPVGSFRVVIEVKALDRPGLLNDVTAPLSSQDVNILHATMHSGNDGVCRMRFEFDVGDVEHLDIILGSIRAIDCVYNASRADR